MPTTVFLNGRFSSPAEAHVSAFDAGFQHAVGLFETMLGGVSAGEPWVFRLDEHMQRLVDSARLLGLSDSLRPRALGDAVIETLKRSELPKARLRLTLTGGDLNMLAGVAAAGREAEPTVMVAAQPATDYPPAMFERGVSAVFADARANLLNPFEGHKTLNYWWRLRELQLAAAKGAAEAIVLGVTNHVVGGCVSNLFVLRGGELVTPIARSVASTGDPAAGKQAPDTKGPALPSPTRPGIVRAWVIEWAERQGIAVHERMVDVSDVMDADEVLLTNSSWGVLPIVKVEAEAIGDGVVGPVAARLRAAWTAEVGG